MRTSAGDVLLQGSANLSAIALCRAGIDANVEIANLLEGPSGHFDDLLLGIDLETRLDKFDTFVPDDDWGDDEPDDTAHLVAPRSVVWAPPQLSGLIADKGSSTLEGGRSVHPRVPKMLCIPLRVQQLARGRGPRSQRHPTQRIRAACLLETGPHAVESIAEGPLAHAPKSHLKVRSGLPQLDAATEASDDVSGIAK